MASVFFLFNQELVSYGGTFELYLYTTTDSDITTTIVVIYFEYCLKKTAAVPGLTPAGAAPLFHMPLWVCASLRRFKLTYCHMDLDGQQ